MSGPGAPTTMVYLASGDAARALDFYKAAFGAEEIMRWIDPDPGANHGKIGHAEFRVAGQTFFVADDYPQMREIGVGSPKAIGGTSVSLWLKVDDLDNVLARALAAGASVLMAIRDDPDNGRRCRITDPGGHVWTLAQA